jgi:hypothetical protein
VLCVVISRAQYGQGGCAWVVGGGLVRNLHSSRRRCCVRCTISHRFLLSNGCVACLHRSSFDVWGCVREAVARLQNFQPGGIKSCSTHQLGSHSPNAGRLVRYRISTIDGYSNRKPYGCNANGNMFGAFDYICSCVFRAAAGPFDYMYMYMYMHCHLFCLFFYFGF